MYRPDAEPSVHLTLFPDGLEDLRDDALAAKWEAIRDVRRVVTGALEVERAAKRIGSSLEASPIIYVADRQLLATLFDIDLAEVCISNTWRSCCVACLAQRIVRHLAPVRVLAVTTDLPPVVIVSQGPAVQQKGRPDRSLACRRRIGSADPPGPPSGHS